MITRPGIQSFRFGANSPPRKIGWANIRPMATDSYIIHADLMSDGQIWQKGLDGYEKLGKVDTQGRYQLRNGQTGNIFQGKQVIIPFLTEQNLFADDLPFTKALQATEKQRALQNSEIPLIRNLLTSKGLTGQGIRVGILDPLGKQKDGTWAVPDHSRAVAQTIHDPIWGVAPQAEVVNLGESFEGNLPIIKSDNLQDFVYNLTVERMRLYDYVGKQIKAATARRDPSLRVLNLTYGEDDFELYQRVVTDLNKMDEQGYFKYPMIRSIVFGPAASLGQEAQTKAVICFVQNILRSSPAINVSFQNYVEATRQAALSGLIIVTAMGNHQGKQEVDMPYEPGYFMDCLSRSPFVIATAASNTNQTPGNFLDDQVASFSGRGDGLNNPTIAAPGEVIGLSHPEGRIGHNLVVQGTSFSAPFTCGIIALMLQRNPYMTFEQIKAKLQNTAVKSPAYGPVDYGAGFLNPFAAVLS